MAMTNDDEIMRLAERCEREMLFVSQQTTPQVLAAAAAFIRARVSETKKDRENG